jgi:hypothetical protein
MGKSCRLVERGSFFGKILMRIVARILDLGVKGTSHTNRGDTVYKNKRN